MSLILSNGQHLTLEDAKKEDRDVLHRLRHCEEKGKMYTRLWEQRSQIQNVVAQHLGLRSSSQCTVQSPAVWNRGHFNICVHVQVVNNRNEVSRKIFRCPMPHKVGQTTPGAVDEKIRSEVASYVWIEQKCKDIPTPHLIGFGLSSGEQFTHQRHLPWYRRLGFQFLRLVRSLTCRREFTEYALHSPSIAQFEMGYMLIDFVDNGSMLSNTWSDGKHDEERKERLYRGLSQIMLSLASQPQRQIGSPRFNEDESLSLSNRPLLCANSILENEGAPRMEGTFSSSGQFLQALQDFRAGAFASQPNAVHDEEDCRLQMSHMILLKNTIPKVVDLDYAGPFFLQFTDLHASNIFVDAEWNITGIIDLEFICSLPPNMLGAPYWLGVEYIDDASEQRDEFTTIYDSFVQSFSAVEKARNKHHTTPLADAMRQTLRSGAYWIFQCFTSVNAMPSLVEEQIYPMFGFSPSVKEEKAFAQSLSRFWSPDSEHFVQQKLAERAQYNLDLQVHYETTKPSRLSTHIVVKL